MAKRVLVLLGTKKGAFILESDASRRSWELSGPFCETWPLNHVIADPSTNTIYATGGNEWFGPAVWKSTDLGKTWIHFSQGLAYAEGEQPIKAGWSLAPAENGVLYAGVEPAGLFRSNDGGRTWEHVAGLRNHPSRADWQPGGGGLILHSIVLHPSDEKKMWVAISTAGAFYTEDGGQTWEPRNKGVRCDYLPEDQRYPEYGQCVHCVVMAAGKPDRLYQQNHCGMYRSDDCGRSWVSIEDGCRRALGSRPRRIRVILTRSTFCRSTATSPAAICRTQKPLFGVRAMPARPGRICAKDCHKRTRFSVFFARPWRLIASIPLASISAPVQGQCLPAPMKVKAGAASLCICPRSPQSKH